MALGFYANVILGLFMRKIKKQRKYLIEHRKELNSRDYRYFSYSADAGYIYPTTQDEILPVKLVENVFEGHTFCIPCKYKKLLEVTYGTTYMELPPVNQRKAHAKRIEFSL